MRFNSIRSLIAGSSICLCLLLIGISFARADGTPAPTAPRDLLSWDSLSKEQNTELGQKSAEFAFHATNTSDSVDVVIDHVQTSCGCTVAKLPSQPWILPPHSNGQVNVSVNLFGKSGTIFKQVTVYFTNGPVQVLSVKVGIPDSPETARGKNQQLALADHQLVFKNNDCAKCHAEPTHGKMGKPLFDSACGICHESPERATMVPDLHALHHPTDEVFWKQVITSGTGKPGGAMPAFAIAQGGPLTDAQIDSLARYLANTIPPVPRVLPTPINHPTPH